MKKHFCAWLGMTAALSFASLSSVVFAEEADQNGVSDPAQSMNVAPDANAEANTNAAPDNNATAPAPAAPNNNATPNQDDAHEDTANSGDDDY